MAAPPSPRASELPLPRTYGRRSLKTLLRLVEALSPPADVIPNPPAERVLGTVLSFIPFLAAPLRHGLPLALWFFEVSPVFFGMGRRRFTTLGDEDAERYLRRWEHGRPPLSMIFQAFRAMILVSFYQHPEALTALEVDWEGRARELVERRGRLMNMSPELANPRNAGPRRHVG